MVMRRGYGRRRGFVVVFVVLNDAAADMLWALPPGSGWGEVLGAQRQLVLVFVVGQKTQDAACLVPP